MYICVCNLLQRGPQTDKSCPSLSVHFVEYYTIQFSGYYVCMCMCIRLAGNIAIHQAHPQKPSCFVANTIRLFGLHHNSVVKCVRAGAACTRRRSIKSDYSIWIYWRVGLLAPYFAYEMHTHSTLHVTLAVDDWWSALMYNQIYILIMCFCPADRLGIFAGVFITPVTPHWTWIGLTNWWRLAVC